MAASGDPKLLIQTPPQALLIQISSLPSFTPVVVSFLPSANLKSPSLQLSPGNVETKKKKKKSLRNSHGTRYLTVAHNSSNLMTWTSGQ